MRASIYNRIFQAADGAWLVFNAWSTALAEVEPGDLEFVRALLADPERTPCGTPHEREIREAAIAARFLLDDDRDETAALKTETLRDRFRTDRLFLTIAPTLDCNFRCDYCYEEHLRITMSRAVRDALVRFVEERARRAELVHVTWFGGEPTLPNAMAVIEPLSASFQALSETHGFDYRAQLVTNGYLLDRKRTEALVAMGIREIQVTLDGPPALHDARRVLAGGQPTFERIVRNLEDSQDLAQFQVRINVDRRNAAAALDLVELLEREGISRSVRLYVAQVSSDAAACGNIVESCFSSEEFARTELTLCREAARRGLPLSRYPFRIPGGFCTADRVNAWVVGPTGALFKCWHEITSGADHAVGHLIDGPQPFHRVNEERWLAWDPLERAECPTCDMLPLCKGGCPQQALRRAGPRGACEPWRHTLEPLLDIRRARAGGGAAPGAPSRGGTGAGS